MDHQCGGSWFTAPWWCGLHFLLLEPFGLLLNRSTRASCGLREGGFNRLVKGGCMAALSGACRFESCTSDQTSELTLFQYGFIHSYHPGQFLPTIPSKHQFQENRPKKYCGVSLPEILIYLNLPQVPLAEAHRCACQQIPLTPLLPVTPRA